MDKAVEAFAREYYGNAPVARDPQIIGAIRNAISAADAARAVGDEEVAKAIAIGRDGTDYYAKEFVCDAKALRAAGLKVVRG